MQHICLTEKGKATDVCHYDEECEVSEREREKERDAWANQSAPIAVALGLIAYAHNDNGK